MASDVNALRRDESEGSIQPTCPGGAAQATHLRRRSGFARHGRLSSDIHAPQLVGDGNCRVRIDTIEAPGARQVMAGRPLLP
jgi:hypothetical protein